MSRGVVLSQFKCIEKMNTRICLIRHGETDWNVNRRIQGQIDVLLNDRGLDQAEEMSRKASGYQFDAIYSSDLKRACDTARRLADRCGLEIRLVQALRERHFGCLQGLTAAEAAMRHPEAYAGYKSRDPDCNLDDGESLVQFALRAGHALEELACAHRGQTVAVISHAGVLDVVYRKATGRALQAPRDFSIPNCALNWFTFDEQGWHLRAWGEQPSDAMGESAE